MDDVINALLQIDKEARQRVARAKKQREKALSDLEEKKQALRESHEAQFSSFVAEQTAKAADEAEAEKQHIRGQFDAVIASLDADAAQNTARWVDEIVAAVTKDPALQ